MTVAILITTCEGMVIATDSSTALTVWKEKTRKVIQVFNSAQKLFALGPGPNGFAPGEAFSGGVAVYGEGTFGPLSWRSFVTEFYCRHVRLAGAGFDILREFLRFAQSKWEELQDTGKVSSQDPIPNAGFFVAAVNKGQYKVLGGRVQIRTATIEPADGGKIQIGGDPTVVMRILGGYDSRLPEALEQEGLEPAKFERCADPFRIAMNLGFMPLRDVVDLTHFLIYSTIKARSFQGINSLVGGPIEIATVTPDMGFRWVLHESLCYRKAVQQFD